MECYRYIEWYVKVFKDCIQQGILKVCQRFTTGLLKICSWPIHWYIKAYGIYNEAIFIVD